MCGPSKKAYKTKKLNYILSYNGTLIVYVNVNINSPSLAFLKSISNSSVTNDHFTSSQTQSLTPNTIPGAYQKFARYRKGKKGKQAL